MGLAVDAMHAGNRAHPCHQAHLLMEDTDRDKECQETKADWNFWA